MGALGYYIFFAINWVITLLPLRILYIFSDFLYLLLYYFPSYRRKVVAENLKNSFPEKTEKELKIIEKKFYRHMADVFVESFKMTHLSLKEHMERVTFSNPEVLDELYAKNRQVIAVMGHYNNWEWLNIIPIYTKYKLASIYKPLQNKYFDHFTNNLRKKRGAVLVPMSNIVREIVNDRKNNILSISVFIADQTPPLPEIRYWTKFLNQDTPVFTGTEKLASKYDMAVIFFQVDKIKRGYYNFSAELLFEHTADLPEHLITDTHVKRLEKIITEKPEYWVWSHRRWKHKKPVENV